MTDHRTTDTRCLTCGHAQHQHFETTAGWGCWPNGERCLCSTFVPAPSVHPMAEVENEMALRNGPIPAPSTTDAVEAARAWHMRFTTVPPYANSPFVDAFLAGVEWAEAAIVARERERYEAEPNETVRFAHMVNYERARADTAAARIEALEAVVKAARIVATKAGADFADALWYDHALQDIRDALAAIGKPVVIVCPECGGVNGYHVYRYKYSSGRTVWAFCSRGDIDVYEGRKPVQS